MGQLITIPLHRDEQKQERRDMLQEVVKVMYHEEQPAAPQPPDLDKFNVDKSLGVKERKNFSCIEGPGKEEEEERVRREAKEEHDKPSYF